MPKRSSRKVNDELRAEYDFRALDVVARGSGRKAAPEVTVRLAPDVAQTFCDSGAVNEALRFLIKIAKRSVPMQGGRATFQRSRLKIARCSKIVASF